MESTNSKKPFSGIGKSMVVNSIIRSHRGWIMKNSALIFGFFEEPPQAKAAMEQLVASGYAVARMGVKLIVQAY
jgi:hypothetical protein